MILAIYLSLILLDCKKPTLVSAGEFASSGGTLRMYRWVNYELGATRTDNGWKVNKVLVDYLVQEANSLEG